MWKLLCCRLQRRHVDCDTKLSVRYKESLYFCSNKGTWKCQSYNGTKEPFSSREKVQACHCIKAQWHAGGSDGLLTAGLLHSYFCLNSDTSQAHGTLKVPWALCNSTHSLALQFFKKPRPQAPAHKERLQGSQPQKEGRARQDGAFRWWAEATQKWPKMTRKGPKVW